jgi:hypothetical protein
LRKAVDVLSLFVGAISFAVVKSPQSVTVNEHWMENCLVSCVRLELDREVATVAVVQLDWLPR